MSMEQTVALAVLVPLLLLAIVGAAGFRVRSSELERRIATISRSFDPYADLSQDIVDAVREGKKIKAIKLYRQSQGGGLKDAKEAIEEMQRRAGVA
jgi:ribosomal protein L7/L12